MGEFDYTFLLHFCHLFINDGLHCGITESVSLLNRLCLLQVNMVLHLVGRLGVFCGIVGILLSGSA